MSGPSATLPFVGDLAHFFECYTSDGTFAANVLCQADVEDMYRITYRQGHSYTVHLPDGDLVFRRRSKLYVADMSDWASSGTAHVTTAQDNGKRYSKAELKRANEAAEMVRNSGFTTERDAVNLVQDNNLEQIPVTAHDIRRAFDIYGKPFESVHGKRTKKKVRRTEIDLSIKAEQPIPQRMYRHQRAKVLDDPS